MSTEVDNPPSRPGSRLTGCERRNSIMDTGYTELYFVFGMMAFIIICATVGLILFVRYLNRDSKNNRLTDPRKREGEPDSQDVPRL